MRKRAMRAAHGQPGLAGGFLVKKTRAHPRGGARPRLAADKRRDSEQGWPCGQMRYLTLQRRGWISQFQRILALRRLPIGTPRSNRIRLQVAWGPRKHTLEDVPMRLSR